MRFRPAGDLAVSIELGDAISLGLNTRVRALEHLIQQKGVPGVVEMVPSYSALLVYYDPLVVGYDALCASVTAVTRELDTAVLPPARVVELPCCYDDPELAFDLEAAAVKLGLEPPELVRLHAEATYHVYFIGFTPGLPYLMLPERLRIPRLDTPRTALPPGSVGLGGGQCCVYSVESPGGFWIIGRTPLRLYDPEVSDPVLLQPGDTVRFRPIDRRTFGEIAAAVAEHTYRPVIT
ncbi:MAG: 5-oxoprolinase subunit PxpB [Candidatus Rokubacteria bacterium]|nr:5-oxoprolinase subunit PxpB [Candidatus Rokubacteria bacterium]